MKLSALVSTPVAPGQDPEIRSIHTRAQEVQPGGLFVAIPGFTADGHDFIADALSAGAAALVVEKPPAGAVGVPVVVVPDTRREVARIAARFHRRPAEGLFVIGITGTNGKTTVTFLVEQMLRAAGHPAGIIGTVSYRFGGTQTAAPMTTPEAPELQRILREMADAGVTHVALEASSHAIALHRLEGCPLNVAVFTNLSQDHLDFHGDMESYWEVKQRLFTRHLKEGGSPGRAVINVNDPRGRALAGRLNPLPITVGTDGDVTVRAVLSRSGLSGMAGTITTPDGPFSFQTALIGGHNLENILCAVGAAIAAGLSPEAIRSGIEAAGAVPGRLERVPDPDGRFVFVDYAHTPHALENVLAALRPLTPGRILCVFGCGGDRDRDKRPKMGGIAARDADLAVVTSDNPRSEAPEAIIAEILPGVTAAGGPVLRPENVVDGRWERGYVVIPDRRAAIELAIRAARRDDVVLIAGKGHETYQIVKGRVLPFDDRAVARNALARTE